VVAPPYFAAHQLVPRLAHFHAEHPDVTVEITTAWPLTAPDNERDLTIIVAHEPLHGDFVARRLARAEVLNCAAPSYLALHGRPREPQDLAAHRLMLPPALMSRHLSFRRVGDDAAAEERVSVTPLRAALDTMQLELNHAGALAGLGIAGLASYAAVESLQDGRLEHVLPGWRLADLSIWACLPTRRHLPASTRAFMDFLVDEFGGRDVDPWMEGLQREGRRGVEAARRVPRARSGAVALAA
jgi:DNA-binding transcriptional LysR family regulator